MAIGSAPFLSVVKEIFALAATLWTGIKICVVGEIHGYQLDLEPLGVHSPD